MALIWSSKNNRSRYSYFIIQKFSLKVLCSTGSNKVALQLPVGESSNFLSTRFFTTQLVAVCHQLSYPTATTWARYLELLFQYL
ncbi:hypothetical protein A6770_35160 [Nostoc minutum NIES-26]|uniref:Uncharacterized protein n=1 Tax=Nostoc minutum NIES-26 TaxID=1844469 RepID=A0A367S0Q0_9NOSO|nr:hypothetical protein A6770_35160 [Nostoc minutum NIES-26]